MVKDLCNRYGEGSAKALFRWLNPRAVIFLIVGFGSKMYVKFKFKRSNNRRTTGSVALPSSTTIQ
uniref:Uncharacterized protein n=1 Tax=Romanomermis culicivorax TaxID=13658 RepID=A0A915HII5_ROMCU